jgi:hypothetical protein
LRLKVPSSQDYAVIRKNADIGQISGIRIRHFSGLLLIDFE